MKDPRVENCKRYAVDAAGKVVGVELQVMYRTTSRYELVRAELFDEDQAGGTHIARCVVLDEDGVEIGERVWLAWPWPAMDEGRGLPGNQDGKHMIESKYDPKVVGPLALYVGDALGNPISDAVGGLGLPNGHHISFGAVWKARPVAVEPEPEPEPDPVDPVPGPGGDGVDLGATLERIAGATEAIAVSLIDVVGLLDQIDRTLRER